MAFVHHADVDRDSKVSPTDFPCNYQSNRIKSNPLNDQMVRRNNEQRKKKNIQSIQQKKSFHLIKKKKKNETSRVEQQYHVVVFTTWIVRAYSTYDTIRTTGNWGQGVWVCLSTRNGSIYPSSYPFVRIGNALVGTPDQVSELRHWPPTAVNVPRPSISCAGR